MFQRVIPPGIVAPRGFGLGKHAGSILDRVTSSAVQILSLRMCRLTLRFNPATAWSLTGSADASHLLRVRGRGDVHGDCHAGTETVVVCGDQVDRPQPDMPSAQLHNMAAVGQDVHDQENLGRHGDGGNHE